jgi:uncharacterized protein
MAMSMPLYDGGVASGLFAGLLFGYVLEGAGFGSPRKLTAQFRLSDWSVFKVMFTAVIVAAGGLWLAEVSGLIKAQAVYVPTLYFWAVAAGGALIGAGFALGGYCPGTSVVGLGSGRGDALVFIVGMVAGTALFATFFTPLEAFYMAGQGPQGQTVSALLGVPDWVVLVALVAMAAGGWRLGNSFERRLGGPVTVETVLEGQQ